MEKLTDNETIKALECCITNDCAKCKAYDETNGEIVDCLHAICRNALNLINRQKAELENQSLEIDILIRKKKSLRDEIAELSASVEELKKTVAEKQTIINEISELITDTCEDCKVKLDANKVKSKAIREFADELFTKFAGHSDYHGDTILCQIICMADGKTTDVAKPLDTSTIKSKAIIEFAKRLKKTMTSTRCDKNGYCHYVTEDCEIDNLVKEMVGDE